MLVIHGDKDYRVPIGEALRLWWDLLSRSKAEDGSSPHKFLYFPDENHWILTRQRQDLVRDGAGVPGAARAGRGMAATGVAGLTC